MQKFLALFSLAFLVFACDDGDVLTINIDFDDEFYACGQTVFYKTKEDPTESLSLYVDDADVLNDIFQLEFVDENELLVQLVNESLTGSGTFNYRTYNRDNINNIFCNDVPPADLQINQDYVSSSSYILTIALLQDDNDGVPAELEDINGNGDLYDDDTDGDGIPNFLDADDDGDNILTIVELDDNDLVDANGDGDNDDDVDGDPLTNPVDTDGDGIPNYLDNDDDGDFVLTIDEENITQDNNPSNDFTNPNVADYLNSDVATTVPATAYRPHNMSLNFSIHLEVNNVTFEFLEQDTFDFGELQSSSDVPTSYTRTVTPPFQ
ncbi:hypothetical protein LRR18_14175 [Mangrovimonas sp. AS39]|uniref:hypothetical protein n=1 Tax=Mangrovimonas TaxID=1211036 RepID=UPI001423B5C6|nr:MULTISPECIES: hypothetical protein [Mangrovimonas]MCF1192739.1 hypothetical protein [Mangrovimonas futianensis]MCF1196340.1 hypothetical protein [Mangrovimonas futianensis]MCF1422797.1 hypothetical protein [Mangrovimonas futianensis]NIK92080.1 hypothetical protein [Mangrovimonas sp. CR14]